MLKVDFHTHSTASDGALSPLQLLQVQRESGVSMFAITDHDTLAGFDELVAMGGVEPTRLISGVEFSVRWGRVEIHVVGLNFAPDDPGLRGLVASQAERRRDRALRMGANFDRLGIPGSYDAACRLAQSDAPGRPHFARFLVESGRLNTLEDAFNRYLGDNKPAFSATDWPQLDMVIERINSAGGDSVLAHPLAYGFTWARLRQLLATFKEAGGRAAEVAVPGLNPDHARYLARLVVKAGLKGSAGSDFHAPRQHWRHPSKVPALPDDVPPVWAEWI